MLLPPRALGAARGEGRDMKKRRGPGFYLILMLLQPLVLALFFLVGVLLDSRLWEGAESVPGHPAPAFTVVLTLLGGAICLVVFLMAGIAAYLITAFYLRKKGKLGSREELFQYYRNLRIVYVVCKYFIQFNNTERKLIYS